MNKTQIFIFLLLICFIGTANFTCPENREDLMMLELYQKLHKDIERASIGTPIIPSYLAAVISLESYPIGNQKSRRFENHIYQRLLNLKYTNKAMGSIKRSTLLKYSDDEIKKLASSYGLTQLMGYHCLELGCKINDLLGDYHLQWSIVWMQKQYAKYAHQKKWGNCFRIHNTGRPYGRPHRKDYVERGIKRMQYYQKWESSSGQIFSFPQ